MKLFSKNESEPERDEIEVRGGGGKSYPVVASCQSQKIGIVDGVQRALS